MAWFWTDDLARVAVAAGLATGESVRDWLERPVAVAAGDDEAPAEVAAGILGVPIDRDEVEPGAA